jgi:hypothetical protein
VKSLEPQGRSGKSSGFFKPARRWYLGATWLFLGSLFFLLPSPAQARVFSFKDETIATYFRGTFGNSAVAGTPYDASSGAGVTVDKKSSRNVSADIGVLFAGQDMNFRLGVEFLMPQRFDTASGSNASGANYFSLDTQTFAFIPSANLEFLFKRSATAHGLLGLGAGYAFVSVSNHYTMTPAGTAALAVTDFSEAASARVLASQLYVGYETLFTDTVTAEFEAGYRYAPVTTLNSTTSATAISGSESAGKPLVNMDGSNRKVNLSGVFVGMSFRFYIGM